MPLDLLGSLRAGTQSPGRVSVEEGDYQVLAFFGQTGGDPQDTLLDIIE